MREIKFRAWDIVNQRMLQWGSGIITLNHQLGINLAAGGFLSKSDGILMQFTGLLDKNGKEIYEGDILQYPSENYNGKVWFSNGSFMTDCRGFGDESLSDFSEDDIEIIGNTHENPELLEK